MINCITVDLNRLSISGLENKGFEGSGKKNRAYNEQYSEYHSCVEGFLHKLWS